jgi:hypothetical protein
VERYKYKTQHRKDWTHTRGTLGGRYRNTENVFTTGSTILVEMLLYNDM